MNVVGSGIVTSEELKAFAVPPAWRKATRNMMLATISIERALASVPSELRASSGLVLNTWSGELETSAEFLTTLSRTGVARPLLFQNSLHNATTGFAAIHLRLTGPTITSAGSLDEALALGEMLVVENQCRLCVVTAVEAHRSMAELIGESVPEAACSVVLSRELPGKPMSAWRGDMPIDARHAPLVNLLESAFARATR